MGYDIILLDADDTLFDYSRAERSALERTCEAFGAPFDSRVLEQYHQINDALWKQFEQGAVTQDALRVRRFESLFAFLGVHADCARVNRFYTHALGEGAFLMDGAEEFCRALSARRPLYIVTNGVSEVQRSRLARACDYHGRFIDLGYGRRKERGNRNLLVCAGRRCRYGRL